MTAGHMWVQIRHPAYVQPQRDGKVNYIAGGYQTQLGAEVHLVSAICSSSPVLPLLRLTDRSYDANRRHPRFLGLHSRLHHPEASRPRQAAPRRVRLDGCLRGDGRSFDEHLWNDEAARMCVNSFLSLLSS
jgi:hypothetical protein